MIVKPFLENTKLILWLMMGCLMIGIALLVNGCSATTEQIIPTGRPTITPTLTVTPTNTPDRNVTPTASPSPVIVEGGPSPTPLLGPTRTPVDEPTLAAAVNPNAPRIEFFTANSSSIAPGSSLTLFWSARGTDKAVIYQLNRNGERERLWNVSSAGNQTINTSARDRGQVDFVLIVGEGANQSEQRLSVPLQCPIEWFFSPAPAECADEEAVENLIIEQEFERGRMLYIADRDVVYVLFNDGFQPAWIPFENRYNPQVHPESIEDFVPPPGFFQPIARLGYVWRGNDTVRNRLGLGVQPEAAFDGFIQTATLQGGAESLYISSTRSTVLQVISGGDVWQLILSQ